MPHYQWSEYQTAIYDRVEHSTAHLIIQATAGAAKSTTLFEIARRLSKHFGRILFLAFNKDIAEYAKTKIQTPLVQCRTFHSFGQLLVKDWIGHPPKLDDRKLRTYINETYRLEEFGKQYNPRSAALKLLRTLRMQGFLSYDEQDLRYFIDEHGGLWSFNQEKEQKARQWALQNLGRITGNLYALDQIFDPIDFDDMVRLPAVHRLITNLKKRYADTVLGDEQQDCNPYQVAAIEQLVKKGARYIGVGDSMQSIYAFRNAYKEDVMDIVKDLVGAEELPLSISYRCPSEVVNFVNGTIEGSVMEAFKEGGLVQEILKRDILATIQEHDVRLVIGARNVSLVTLWIFLAKHNIGSSLKGVGVTDPIRRAVDDLDARSLEDLRVKIGAILAANTDAEGECSLPQMTQDVFMCITCLCNELQLETLEDMEQVLRRMEENNRINLLTVHKAKGLEHPSVLVLNDWFWCDQKENMRFVAYTRSAEKLFHVLNWFEEEREDEQEPSCALPESVPGVALPEPVMLVSAPADEASDTPPVYIPVTEPF